MPIDASIPLGVKPFQIESPINQLAKVLQIGGMQQDQQMGQMKMDEYRRSVDDQNALRADLSGAGADPYNVLIRHGRVKEATDFAKGKADITKTTADTEKSQLETAHKRIDMLGQVSGWVRQNPTPENAAQAIQHLQMQGVLTPQQAQQEMAKVQADPSPQGIANFADMAFRASLQAKDQLPKLQTNNIGGQTVTQSIDAVTGKPSVVGAIQNTQSPDNAATNARVAAEGAANRGQAERHFQGNQSAGKVPAGYRMTADGGLEFIPGGPADPNAAKRAAPTEFQGKAGMFGNRAQEADRIISELEGKYSPSGINTKQALGRTPLIGGGLEAASNMALSDSSQKAEQAQRDFVNAILRLESGAAISQGEFDNARKQYFRQPGDAPAVIAQKAQNRKTAIQGLMNNARPGSMEQPARAAQAGPSIDDLLKKYGGK
jgi:hypothetical protein